MIRLDRLLFSLVTATALAVPPLAFAQEDRQIDRGEDTEDLLAIAKRQTKTAPKLFFDAYRHLEWKTGEAFQIDAKTIDVPYGTLTLSGGWVIPVAPEAVDSRDLADKPEGYVPDREYIFAVYIGDGSFTYQAPNPTERWVLNQGFKDLKIDKASDRDGLEVTVDGGALFQLNGKWRALLAEGGKPGTIDKKTEAAAKKIWTARADLSGISWARNQTRDAFEGEERGFLGLELQTKTYRAIPYLSYSFDPNEHEAFELGVVKRYALNRDSITARSLGAWVDPAKAEGKSDRELAYLATEWEVDAKHYTQDMTVYRDSDLGEWGMEVTGTVELEFLKGPHKTLRLALMNFGETGSDRRVTLQGLTDGQGNRLEFLHHQHEIVAVLPRTYEAGDTLDLKYKYSGLFIDTIKQAQADVSLADTNTVDYGNIINYRVPNDYPWYPQVPGHVDSSTFDWVLRVPKPMIAATSGVLLSLEEVDKMNVHTIKEEVPVSFPAILFGNFSLKENDPDYDKGETKIRVYIHPGFEKDVQSFIDEAQSILNYYSAIFGPYPYKELDLAQMPGFFGYAQAPAGLVQMTGEVYMSKTDLANLYGRTADLRDYFIPHEIGHEWWGHRAGWGSYRDQWVSETFAEFSAALYVEERDRRKSGNPDDTSGYDMRAADWRRGRRGHVQSRTSPLWLGGRHAHYQSTVYARGPLVLDQLRQAFGREAVVKVMNYFNNWANDHGGNAITDDFQMILEQAIPGVAFEDFLNEFIKGNAELPDKGKTGAQKKTKG